MLKYMDIIEQLTPDKQWRKPIGQLSAALLITFIIYSHTVMSITSIWWRSETFAHGMLIIPFSLYMIWLRRERIASLQPTIFWPGLLMLGFAVIFWLLGTVVDAQALQQLALLGMIWSLVLIALGVHVVNKILYPLAFLFFAIPIGEGLIPYLMDFTAYFTVSALKISGFPVLWQGMSFSIPSGSFEVATACSGVRYLFASVTLGSLFAYINYQSYWRRTLFIIVSIVLPIIANGLRAYGIVLIAHFSDMKYAVGFDHLIYGWLFFGLIMFLLFYIGSHWRETSSNNSLSVKETIEAPKNYKFDVLIAIITVSILIFGPLWEAHIKNSQPTPAMSHASFSEVMAGWTSEPWDGADWMPEFKGAKPAIKKKYVLNSNTVMLYIAAYAKESQGVELINQDNRLYRQKMWSMIANRQVLLKLSDHTIHPRLEILRSGNVKRMLLYWYDLDGYVTTNIYSAKLHQAWRRITGRNSMGAIVAVAMDIDEDAQADASILKNFTRENYASLQAYLTQLRTGQ